MAFLEEKWSALDGDLSRVGHGLEGRSRSCCLAVGSKNSRGARAGRSRKPPANPHNPINLPRFSLMSPERLQVADPPTDLVILRIADGVPKSSRCGIVEGDQRGHPMDATLAQIVLAGPRQRESDAFPPMSIADGEPIHVPSPPVPGGDQGADDLPVSLGYEESSRGFINQSLDFIKPIRRTCVLTAALCPQIQYRRQVRLSAAAYGDFLAGQVRSITLRSVFPMISKLGRSLCLPLRFSSDLSLVDHPFGGCFAFSFGRPRRGFPFAHRTATSYASSGMWG